MIAEFIQAVEPQLQNYGYKTEKGPLIPGVRGLLKAVSPKITSVGPAKFFNYFLFLDWDNDLFSRLDNLINAQRNFRVEVNKDFKVPNAWRMTLPNIMVAAVSDIGFSKDAIKYVQSNYQIPWTGGEVGQMMLFDLQNRTQYCHFKKTYKQTGSIPLCFAVDELYGIFKAVYPDAQYLTE